MTERIHKKGIQNFGIGIIGISSVIEKIKESHESALRIFSYYHLEPLNPSERKIVIELGLDEAKEKMAKKQRLTKMQKNLLLDFQKATHIFFSNMLTQPLKLTQTTKSPKRMYSEGW